MLQAHIIEIENKSNQQRPEKEIVERLTKFEK